MAAFPHALSRAASHPKPTPEWLVEATLLAAAARGDVADVHAAAAAADGGAKNALVSEECPKCKNPQMEFWTMQTRVRDWRRGGGGGRGGGARARVGRAGSTRSGRSASPLPFPPHSAQSADEGQTVFYRCPLPACKHMFSLNT